MKKLTFFLSLALASFASQAKLTATNCVISEPIPGSNATGIFLDVHYEMTQDVKDLRLPAPEMIQGATIHGLEGHVEVHKTVMKDGVMKMQHLPNVVLKPNTTTKFERGGLHLMITDLKSRPVAGETYEMTLWNNFLEEPTCTATVVKLPRKQTHKH